MKAFSSANRRRVAMPIVWTSLSQNRLRFCRKDVVRSLSGILSQGVFIFFLLLGLSVGRSAFAASVPDDVNWDDKFGPVGLDNTVNAVVPGNGTEIYVAGKFGTAGKANAGLVAMWDTDTSTWSGLGNGLSGGNFPEGRAIAVDAAGNVYVGGTFTTAGGNSAQNIAKWEPSTSAWSALGAGVAYTSYGTGGTVNSIEVVGTDIYVGGYFLYAGGVSRNYIAKWDGISWSGLGSGLNSAVVVLEADTDAGKIYVGGYFTTAGGTSANRIAAWDTAGYSWSALGSGINDTVYGISLHDDGIYAGGYFTTTGGNAANGVAKWDSTSSSWSALADSETGEEGTTTYVYGMASVGNVAYAAGAFHQMGGKAAAGIAEWDPIEERPGLPLAAAC